MKKVTLLILFLLSHLDSLSQDIFADKSTFSRQDSLRGSITKERAWWDLNYYHLDIKINPKKILESSQNP